MHTFVSFEYFSNHYVFPCLCALRLVVSAGDKTCFTINELLCINKARSRLLEQRLFEWLWFKSKSIFMVVSIIFLFGHCVYAKIIIIQQSLNIVYIRQEIFCRFLPTWRITIFNNGNIWFSINLHSFETMRLKRKLWFSVLRFRHHTLGIYN